MKNVISYVPAGTPSFKVSFKAGGEPEFHFGDSCCGIEGVDMDTLNWMIEHGVLSDLAAGEKERRRLADEEAYMKANAVEIIGDLRAKNEQLSQTVSRLLDEQERTRREQREIFRSRLEASAAECERRIASYETQ